MRELTDRALNVAEVKGATYADIRIVRRENQGIVVKNGKVEGLSLYLSLSLSLALPLPLPAPFKAL